MNPKKCNFTNVKASPILWCLQFLFYLKFQSAYIEVDYFVI